MTKQNLELEEASRTLSRRLSVPRFSMKVAGEKIKNDIAALIKSITLTDYIDKMPKLQIALVDAEIRLADYWRARLTETNAFSQYSDVDLWLGLGDWMSYKGRYKITRISPEFGEDGVDFGVQAYGLEWIFNQSRTEGALKFAEDGEKIYSSDAVKDILAYYPSYKWNLRGIRDGGLEGMEKWYIFKESDLTDLAFLYRIGRRDGWRFWIESREINFDGKYDIEHIVRYEPILRDAETKFHFWYEKGMKSDIIRFTPEIDEKEKGSKFLFVAWDKEKGRPLIFDTEIIRKGDEFFAQRNPENPEILELKTWTSGDLVPLAELINLGGRFRIEALENIKNPTELESYAKKIWAKMKTEWIMANGTVFGWPSFRAGDVIELHNVGLLYSGKYLALSTTHKMAENNIYTTDFSARKIIELEA